MNFGFHPVPKKPFKGKKKQEVFKGRTIPTKRERGKINKTDYQRVIDEHGFECWYCGTTQNLECHHVMFRSQGGRGVFYNLRFLCSDHHRTGKDSVHQNKKIMKKLQYEHEKMFGKYYSQDRFDLFKSGLIPTPTKEAYESFMEKEIRKCRK